ncbi:hypothetical protein HA466_0170010 [Hirschfeldia incana]|nr:hypothetical protein HA466_0170010 [Hirschfeldia incana]
MGFAVSNARYYRRLRDPRGLRRGGHPGADPRNQARRSGAFKLSREGFLLLQFAPAAGVRQYDWSRKQGTARKPLALSGSYVDPYGGQVVAVRLFGDSGCLCWFEVQILLCLTRVGDS